ncbi:MAG: chromate efflux transporter [Chloroflexi bacterium]|nr:chromate efflux transporter [Chloroflexota bacterium]
MSENRLGETARYFLRLGFTAFGGPAAHIAMMRRDLVQRRAWVTEQQFLDLLGAVNLIPGPNSTEMAIHLGYLRAGWPGLIVGGALFILPAMAAVLALAWAYVSFGAMPEAAALLYGIKPVIIAIVAQALWGLVHTAFKTRLLGAIGLGVLALYLVGGNELALLFGGGLIAVLIRIARDRTKVSALAAAPWAILHPTAGGTSVPGKLAALAGTAGAAGATAAAAAAPYSLLTLFLTFLKTGAVLYGSGYVLLAFLRNDFVERLGWLTERQLLDAVAIGQFTPGPVFTTATFVGYVAGAGLGGGPLAGLAGAVAATLGIFLPSFVFVAVSGPLIPRLRSWPLIGALLDGVNAAAVGLMAGVLVALGRAALVDPLTVALALGAGAALWRTKINSVWLIVAGGVIGVLAGAAGLALK